MRTGLFSLLGAVWLTALHSAPEAPLLAGRIDNVLRPMPPVAPDQPEHADRTWAEIAAMIASTPALSVTDSSPAIKTSWSGYILVQETANRILRETGLRFAQAYPEDPRVWTWLESSLDREPAYVDLASVWQAQFDPLVIPAREAPAANAWQIAFDNLRDRCIASSQAPDSLRIRLWMARIGAPLTAESWARALKKPFDASTLDLEALASDLMALGEQFPTYADDKLRNLARALIACANRYAPAVATSCRARLTRSPNTMLRHLAEAEQAVADARKHPMVMRFTALDGTKVDLEQLRGKVVLIDFRGVTWCGACREEEPTMKDVYARYRAKGFEILTITFENKPESREFVRTYVKERGLSWPHSFDGAGSNNPYIQRFGIVSVPQHFLLDQAGLLVSTDVRGPKLEPAVRRLLGLR
ncbi:MAG: TlpA family protein disulfide reductase [Opitutaceae bacterium]|nr:TlpA family protein disulfide reductase [Opitutaceae bacterium]